MDLFSTTENKLPFDLPREEGYRAEWSDDFRGFRIVVPNGELIYAENFFSKKISDRCVEYFQENESVDWRTAQWKKFSEDELSDIKFTNIQWRQEKLKLYGKLIPFPRLTSWFGDSGKSYSYSGVTSRPNPWNKGLLYLKEEIEKCAGVEFNSVLLNWYRDGEDSLSWHADDEKELGINPIIASANFGETRDFIIRRNEHMETKITLPLRHGTLLIMRGELQHFWQHSVPKRKNIRGSRFNLTFRRIGIS
jgi:alkylated DNA repair dioxygenase AlkB